MNYQDSSPQARLDALLPEITSIAVPLDRRSPIKHILLGAPVAVQHTTHRLHQLGYAQVSEWARPLPVTEPLIITPSPGDVIRLLVRYLSIES